MDLSSASLTNLSADELALLDQLLADEGIGDSVQDIQPRSADSEPVLSFAQERLWFLEQWQPGTAVYHISFALQLDGDLDVVDRGAGLPLLEKPQTLLGER